MDNLDFIRRVKRHHEGEWMAHEAVTAVGIGLDDRGQPALIISVTHLDPAVRHAFPEEVETVPVILRVSGQIDAGG